MPHDPLQLLTLDEAAVLLGVHRRTVDRMIASGDLQAFRWHRTRRVYRNEVERFVKVHTTRTGRKPVSSSPSPAARTGTTSVADDDEPSPTEEPAAPTLSIAVLEDDENIRRFLSFALAAEGYAVHQCSSYDELLQTCDRARPDVVISDGWGVSSTTLEPADRESIAALARRFPTILTTGRDWAGRANPADLGLVAIFRKPFELEHLVRTVRSLETGSSEPILTAD